MNAVFNTNMTKSIDKCIYWVWMKYSSVSGLMVKKKYRKLSDQVTFFFHLAFKLQLALHILTKYINVIPYPYTLPISRKPNPHLWSRKAYNRSTGSSLHLSSKQLAPRGRSRHFTQGDGPGHQLWCHFKDIRSHKGEKKKKAFLIWSGNLFSFQVHFCGRQYPISI